MKLVGPALHADRHGAARGAPVLRVVVAVLNLVFRHRLRRGHETHVGRVAAFRARVGHAVQQQIAGARDSPVDGHALGDVVAGVERPCRAAQRIGADIELHARGHDAQQERIASLRRQVGDVLFAHHLALVGGQCL